MRYATTIFLLMLFTAALVLGGCTGSPKQAPPTGFLSDYSRLRSKTEAGQADLRYVNQEQLRQYTQFIIDPVVVHLHDKDQSSALDQEKLNELTTYAHGALVNAIQDGYAVVAQPGPGVARVRLAITDIKKSKPALSVVPQMKLLGTGLGGAAMEAEVVDAVTGEQLAAAIDARGGNRLTFDSLSSLGDAKGAIDAWAGNFRKGLDKIHGRK